MILKCVLPIILITVILCGCSGTQGPPAIEYGEFPFRVVYELNGEMHTIEDTVISSFRGFDNSSPFPFTKPRSWDTSLKSGGTGRIVIFEEENINSALTPERVNEISALVIHFGAGEYYMGDPNGSSLIHGKPHLCYSERYETAPNVTRNEATPLSHIQAEELFGIIITEWSFSEPIKNIFE